MNQLFLLELTPVLSARELLLLYCRKGSVSLCLRKTFRGIRYNSEVVKDLSRLSALLRCNLAFRQEDYHRLDKYNYIRIEHSQEFPQMMKAKTNTPGAGTMEKWLEDAVLIQDREPALYIHNHYFTLNGSEYCRRTIISTVKVEDWSKMIIRPHEGTLPKARSDREMLLRSLNANTSPVFSMYEDAGNAIGSILDNLTTKPPQIATAGYDNDRHELWVVTEPGALQALSCLFESRPLYIADGHHRYESALKYRREQEALLGSATGEEPFNFVMMEMVSVNDPGLIILPAHRLIRGVKWANINGLIPRLEELFDITEFHPATPDNWNTVEEELEKPGATRLALFGLGGDRVHMLSVKDQAILNQ